MAKKKPAAPADPKLTDTEADLLRHLQSGYQLESSALERGLLLRRLKDNEVIRTASANQSTVKALEERGVISEVKSQDPLTTVWRAKAASSRRSTRKHK